MNKNAAHWSKPSADQDDAPKHPGLAHGKAATRHKAGAR